ncbi:MAG: L-threonylcarbamoyladenylate synthase [Candidatus Gracilibacteria bacterium]|nr:L-threonylcarbamoyladenylate synthase [Candidatus Gracilibacteria bacterium]
MLKQNIKKAASIIKNGGVVAFPTETVYGLGANIYNKDAIMRIFEIKGRASDNPLIVHIDNIDKLTTLAIEIPKITYELAKKFWPGPLTIVFKKSDSVINEVSAGSDTVAIRIPNNSIAIELLKIANVPIAAPSANLSGKPSPTKASHVKDDLLNKVDYILDGGETIIGVESTVIDITVSPPILLRPGGVSLEELRELLPNIQLHPNLKGESQENIIKSPGMKYRHYAPDTNLFLFNPLTDDIELLIKKYKYLGNKIGVIATLETHDKYNNIDKVFLLGSRKKMTDISKNLFNILREVDKYGLDLVFCETFEEKGIGLAVMDRLKRACEKK